MCPLPVLHSSLTQVSYLAAMTREVLLPSLHVVLVLIFASSSQSQRPLRDRLNPLNHYRRRLASIQRY